MIKPPSEWTVLTMLKWATSYFEEKEVRNPRFSIEWLLANELNVKRLDLYLMFDRPLTLEELKERLADRLDEITLLELLNITSYDLVERFSDLVEDNYDKLQKEINDDYEPDELQ